MSNIRTHYLRFRKRFRWLSPCRWHRVWQFKRYCARYPEKVRDDGCIDANDLCWLNFIGKPELHDKRQSINVGFEPDVVIIGEPFINVLVWPLARHWKRKVSGRYKGGEYDKIWRKPDE